MNEFIIQRYSRSIFNFPPFEIKQMFMKIETKSKRLITNNLDQEFNNICSNENLLPIFTNILVYTWCFLFQNDIVPTVVLSFPKSKTNNSIIFSNRWNTLNKNALFKNYHLHLRSFFFNWFFYLTFQQLISNISNWHYILNYYYFLAEHLTILEIFEELIQLKLKSPSDDIFFLELLLI